MKHFTLWRIENCNSTNWCFSDAKVLFLDIRLVFPRGKTRGKWSHRVISDIWQMQWELVNNQDQDLLDGAWAKTLSHLWQGSKDWLDLYVVARPCQCNVVINVFRYVCWLIPAKPLKLLTIRLFVWLLLLENWNIPELWCQLAACVVLPSTAL